MLISNYLVQVLINIRQISVILGLISIIISLPLILVFSVIHVVEDSLDEDFKKFYYKVRKFTIIAFIIICLLYIISLPVT